MNMQQMNSFKNQYTEKYGDPYARLHGPKAAQDANLRGDAFFDSLNAKQEEAPAPEEDMSLGDKVRSVGSGITKAYVGLPTTAARFGQDLGDKLGETSLGKKAGDLIRGGANAIFGEENVKDFAQGTKEALDTGVKKNSFVDPINKYEEGGKLAGDVSQAFIPVGGAAKLGGLAAKSPKVAQAAETLLKVAKPVIESTVMTGAQTGDAKQAATAGAFTAAAPIPFKLAKGLVKKVVPGLTGVASDIYADVFARPDKYDAAAQILKEHPDQPFLGLAQRIAEKAQEAQGAAKDAWREAAVAFRDANPLKKFDVSAKVPDIKKAITGTEKDLGFGLKAVKERAPGTTETKLTVGPDKEFQMVDLDKKGKMSGQAHLEPSGKVSGWTDKEMGKLNDLVSTLQSSKNIGPEEVLELDRVFDTAYNDIPFNNDGSPTRYHAAVMALKKKTEEEIEKILPKELQEAYASLRRTHELQEEFVDKIADRQGNLKDGASTFLSSLGNLNRGERRLKADKFAQDLGMDPVDAVNILKNASKLKEATPQTGKRTLDVIRAWLTGGGIASGGASLLGGATGVGLPLLAGSTGLMLASSPSATGAAVKGLGKINQKIDPKVLKSVAPMVLKALSRLAGEESDSEESP